MDLEEDPRAQNLRVAAEAALGVEPALFAALIEDAASADKLRRFLGGGERPRARRSPCRL